MAPSESSERSFSLRGVRNRMQEKKKGVLRSAKLNASLASKIKTKIIKNSCINKASLKNNNKALAQALNAEKANAQQLAQEKVMLQKEVEHCHFQNAVLRHKVSFLTNTLKEFEKLIAAVKTARLSEFCPSSPSLSIGQKSSTSEDSWGDYVVDSHLLSARIPMRVPISKVRGAVQQGGSSAVVQTSSLYLRRPASNECPEAVPVASKDILPPQPAEKPQSHEEENGKKVNEAVESQEVLPESHIFGEALCATQQNPNILPALDLASPPLSYEDNEMAKQFSDRLSEGHVTLRKKCSTQSATSTPSSNVKNRGFDLEQHCCSPDKVQDLRRTYIVNPAQLHSLGSGDLLQQVKNEAVFKIQSMESLSKSPTATFSSHEIPSDDSSLQNSLSLWKETSSACALQEDSSVSKTTIRQKPNRKTRVIRQNDYSDEKNLPNSVKIPETIGEEQPERSKTIRKTVRKSSSGGQRNEVDGFGPYTDVQDVIKESTKDLLGNLKCSRKTYVICPLDLAGNLGSAQTDFERGEVVPPRSIPGSKASKIPRNQKLVATQSSKNQTRGLQEKGPTKAGNKVNVSEKQVYPKPKPQRKRKSSAPPETDTLIGAKVHTGSSSELVCKETLPKGKSSCITDRLPEQDALLKEQIAEISVTNNLVDLSHSLKSSSETCSVVSPVKSRLTDVLVSRRLSSEGNRMPKKSSGCPGSSLAFKEKTAEEIPEERKQLKSSSWSLPSEKPAIRPLQDLTNARTLSPSSSEEASRCSSRRRRGPVCYAEPKLNRKLRRGDPFTDTQFLRSSLRKTKKSTLEAKEITGKIKKEEEWLTEICPIVSSLPALALGRDVKLEVE